MDLEWSVSVDGDDARNRCLPIENGDRSAPPDGPQVLAEMGLQVGNPDSTHDLIMIMSGQFIQARRKPSISGDTTSSAAAA